MRLYFAEYREGIGTGEVYVALPESLQRSHFKIKVEDSTLKCLGEEDLLFSGKLPFKLLRGQGEPAVSVSEDGLVCIRFSRQSITPVEIASACPGIGMTAVKDFISWSSERAHLPYTIKCSFCGHVLSKEGSVFSKLFPLPSDDFKEFSSDIFCHGQSMDVEHVVSGNLVPKSNECFLNETFVTVCQDALSPRCVLLSDADSERPQYTSVATCCRCLLTLGKGRIEGSLSSVATKSESVAVISLEWEKIVLHTKGFPTVGVAFQDSLSLTASVANKLRSFVEQFGRFRFLLKDITHRVYACLWYMNAKVLMSTNVRISSNFAKTFLLGQDTEDKNATSMSFRATKVLFKNCFKEENKSSGTSWTKDMTVESLVLEESECVQVLLSLESSCLTLPPTMREANTFSIGYLQVF